jgi:hypothetical protein
MGNRNYEIHVTVTPKDARLYDDFKSMADAGGWKTSMFDHDDVDDIAGKWFITTHTEYETQAYDRMRGMVYFLQRTGFTVERSKIEHIVYDTKRGDV